jgi:hypothetical protein
MRFPQLLEKNGNAEADTEPFVPKDVSGPGVIAWFMAEHGDDILDMAHIEKVGDDSFQFLVADAFR